MRAFHFIAPRAMARLGILLGFAVLTAACSSTSPQRPEPGAQVDDTTLNTLIVVAEMAFERGDCKTASEGYAEVAALLRSASHARRAAEVALACEHLPAAWQSVTYLRSLEPDDREAATLYAAVALKLHRIPRAREALSAVIRTGSDDADRELIELTTQLLEASSAASVLAAVNGALEGTTPSPPILVMLGELALKVPNLQLAEQYTREALRRDPSLLPAKRLLSRIHVQRGEADQAIALAMEVAQADQEGGRFELADTLAALERIEEARQELDRLRSDESIDRAEVDRRLALLALNGGDFDEAQRRFAELAINGQAGDAALFYIAEIAARSGNEDAALSGYRRLADSAFAAQARIRAARILLERKEYTEAMQLLDDYAAQNPTSNFEMTLAKAHLLADTGDSDGALRLIAAALDQYPDHPTLQYDQAVLLEDAGRVQEAIATLRRLLAERPDDPVILNALGYTLADHGVALDEAERVIRRALEMTPDSPATLDSLGWVRFRRGDHRGAVALLERAYHLGRDPEIAAHWGEALWASGDQQAARRVWAAALARDPDSEALKAMLARFLPAGTPAEKGAAPADGMAAPAEPPSAQTGH